MAARVAMPEGIHLNQTREGEFIEHRGRHGQKTRMRIDTEWAVMRGTEILGHVRFTMITRETRSEGRRYVNNRWESPGWQYREFEPNGTGHWFESYSKTHAVSRVVTDSNYTKENS